MKLKTLAVACLALVVGLSAHANTRNVGNVTWQKSTTGTIDEFRNLTYSNKAGGMVFIRPTSNDEKAKESSTNIGVDGRFLVSVQDGHYTSSAVCAGTVQLSAVPTGVHINDLSAEPLLVSVRPHEVQYFVVRTGANYRPQLEQVNSATAGQLLQNTYRQGHQISRVDVNNCPEPIALQPVVMTPPPVVAPPVQQEVPTLRLNIQFDHDKSNIKPEFRNEVDKAAQFLAQYPNMDAIIEGHTDSNGTDAYNIKLSQRRANAVRQALITHYGINPSRLSAVGYGESRPIATNSTAEGRYTNRRVMVVIPQASR
ncbi:MAG: OmpA family protein [Moraxella sp.]|nr:OmpA family protein [Moraxella sp.]